MRISSNLFDKQEIVGHLCIPREEIMAGAQYSSIVYKNYKITQ